MPFFIINKKTQDIHFIHGKIYETMCPVEIKEENQGPKMYNPVLSEAVEAYKELGYPKASLCRFCMKMHNKRVFQVNEELERARREKDKDYKFQIKQNVPGFVEGYKSKAQGFNTLEELLDIPFVDKWTNLELCEGRFHRFTKGRITYGDVDHIYIVAEFDKGEIHCMVGHIVTTEELLAVLDPMPVMSGGKMFGSGFNDKQLDIPESNDK